MPLVVRDLGLCPYADALALQERLVAAKLDGDPDDYLLVVEHPPVFTLGRGADRADLGDAPTRLAIPALRVGRGGGVTFHGPGQLVAYPIVALTPGRRDVRAYVRRLEAALLRTCAAFGLDASSDGPHPGVWVGGAKLAAIGIAMRRWVTFHGVALNVAPDLAPFAAIVPCRVPGLAVTSLARLCSPAPSVQEVRRALVRELTAELQPAEERPARPARDSAPEVLP